MKIYTVISKWKNWFPSETGKLTRLTIAGTACALLVLANGPVLAFYEYSFTGILTEETSTLDYNGEAQPINGILPFGNVGQSVTAKVLISSEVSKPSGPYYTAGLHVYTDPYVSYGSSKYVSEPAPYGNSCSHGYCFDNIRTTLFYNDGTSFRIDAWRAGETREHDEQVSFTNAPSNDGISIIEHLLAYRTGAPTITQRIAIDLPSSGLGPLPDDFMVSHKLGDPLGRTVLGRTIGSGKFLFDMFNGGQYGTSSLVYGATMDIQSVSLRVIPEPAVLSIELAGLLLIASVLHRRRIGAGCNAR